MSSKRRTYGKPSIFIIEATEFELSMFKYSVASREVGEAVVLMLISPSIKYSNVLLKQLVQKEFT